MTREFDSALDSAQSAVPEAAGPAPTVREPLTSGVGVSLLLIVTGILLQTLTVCLYVYSRPVIKSDAERWGVLVGVVVLTAMSLLGAAIGVWDLVRRYRRRRQERE